MRLFFVSVFLLFLQVQVVVSQEITAQIVDAQSKEPIPFATVQYAPYKGVITNEEGRFSFREILSGSDIITISSLGYETQELTVEGLKQPVIFLKPQSIALQDVFLTNKNLKGKEILQRVKENISSNYDFNYTQKKFFFRESNINQISQFDLEVEESSIPELNQNFMNKIAYSVPKKTDSYKEVLGELYGNYDRQKMQVIKAANLYNPPSQLRLDQLTDKLEKIFQQNIKENSYLKIRSGIIGVKVESDDFKSEVKEEKKVVEKTRTPEEREKYLAKRNQDLKSSTSRKIQDLWKTMFWKEDITLNIFDKTNKYRFNVEGFANMDNSTVYVISFEPKRGADFKGKIYVNTIDYGVHRLDYENVKPLSKFRLLGISTMDDVYRGKMIFTKDEAGKYHAKYIEQEKGDSFGIDRPLTIIEKNKYVPGRRKQNELDLEIRIKSGDVRKYQLVIYENNTLEEGAYQALKTSDNFDYQTFKAYNPEFWNGYNIIEPNAAIKAFTAMGAEEI